MSSLSSCSKFLHLLFINSNTIIKPNSLFKKKKENELDPPRPVIYSTESNDLYFNVVIAVHIHLNV